jgi:hypothetical protein
VLGIDISAQMVEQAAAAGDELTNVDMGFLWRQS